MGRVRFPGGVHPRPLLGGKGTTSGKAVKDARAPKQVSILLGQSVGAPCTPLVKPGDLVKIGQKIGEPQGFVGAPVHASVSGKVLGIHPSISASGANATAIVIENDFKDDWVELSPLNPDALSAQELLKAIREAGVVGLGGAAFPTQVKLSPPKDKSIDTVILNGAECEPFLTCDHRTMLERTDSVLDGLLIARKILGASRACIGIEANKPDAIEAIEQAARGKGVEVITLPEKYPQGGEKQLIQALTGRQVPSGKLPMDVGCVVVNVSTSAAISDAVRLGKPIVDRVVTVTGAIDHPQNLRVRIGDTVASLIEQCGGLRPEVNKLILGGPMMGQCAVSANIPISKSTSGVLLLVDDEKPGQPIANCIRCTRCVRTCPIGLQPLMLYALSVNGRHEQAEAHHAMDCVECGCCAYACPAKLPLVQAIRVSKREIQKVRQRRNVQ